MQIVYPEAIQGIVHRAQGHICTYQGWPTVCCDENGVLYAVASGYRSAHVCPFGKTVLYVSRNGGKTWSPPIIVNDTYLDDRDAGILYLGNGRMLITWFNHPAEVYHRQFYKSIAERSSNEEVGAALGMMGGYAFLPEEELCGGSYLRISEDYGMTWSEKIRLPISAPHGPNLCRDGSLIYLGKEMYALPGDDCAKGAVCAYRSTDGGYSWKKQGEVPLPEGMEDRFEEPHVIERPDGTLLGAFRAQGEGIPVGSHDYKDIVIRGFSIYTATSADGGKTWSEPMPTGINGAPPHLMLHSSGALICSYGRREKPYGQRAAVSTDGGKTWEKEYVLNDQGPDYDLGYASSAELPDGKILSTYYQKCPGDSKCSILYAIWKL